MPSLRSLFTSILPALAACLVLATACAPKEEIPEETLETEPELIGDPYLTVGEVPSADGLSIAYSTRGGGTTALVFVHGWSCDRTYWSEQIDDLARDYQVITVDLGGHGDSGTDRQQWTFGSLAEDVRAVVEHLNLERVILVGHSMGGPVSLEAARLLPERVVGVIGADTLHDANNNLAPEVWDEFLTAYRADFPGTCSTMVRSMFTATAEPALVDSIEADMCSAPPGIALSLFEQFKDYDSGASLAAAGVPIRVINAANNPTNIEGNREFSPGFDAIVMEDVGHFLMMEEPEAFNRYLRELLTEWTESESGAGDGDSQGKSIEG